MPYVLHLSLALLLAVSSTFPTHKIDSIVRAQLGTSGAPGIALAIVRHGTVAYERGFGENAIDGKPVNEHTHFQIGSDTKQFTACAILQLKEAGKLRLEDTLAKFVPAFPHASELTLRELLDQTSGLPDYVQTNHFVAISQSTPGSLTKIEAMIKGPLHFRPGSKWEYSNSNYAALGRVVEVVSGQSFQSYVRAHLFAPAGMRESGFIANQRSLPDRATGYWRGMKRKGALRPAPDIGEGWTAAAGDIVSTVDDLVRWDQALLGGKIVTSTDFKLMTSPMKLLDGTTDDYGFGWWIDAVFGHVDIYHDGDTFGMSSSNNLFMDSQTQIIVLQNLPDDAAANTARAVYAAILPTL